MNKTPHWLHRKYKQVDREKYEQQQAQAESIHRGITVVLDVIFNNGKEAENLLLPYEEALERLNPQLGEEHKSEYVTDVWWKPGR
ncbi:hypothetical protein SAMN05421743_105223 [Thalassobacillus cyri]|uniref:Uncharacterized protein n=1 Tax=Thalassobacillus cyri TaxID=571932 RepID=A0A1H4C0P5_9BACI|nr:hypothetical protein [Thalassobacillus cyri]SEA54015.1 hypothetical protein SAMN05421743_105223 [Thalassobacillus cyri]